MERSHGKERRTLRLIVSVTERSIDKKGRLLLGPEVELEGWWTSLDEAAQDVIDHYKRHGTHEQFHSEITSDLDLERLPRGSSTATTPLCIWPCSPTTAVACWGSLD